MIFQPDHCNIFLSIILAEKLRVTTDKWRGYRPISKAYDITQIESNRGLNFKALHTMIHQVKSWIRTTYSWVSDNNLNRYFNEFCFRINRSQSKSTIFNNLITTMIEGYKIYQSVTTDSIIYIRKVYSFNRFRLFLNLTIIIFFLRRIFKFLNSAT